MNGYEDMLALSYRGSRTHRMSARDRAAQFSPFAALTGYGDQLDEAAREVSAKTDPDEADAEEIDRTLRELTECIRERPGAEITYFVRDARKDGGEYRTVRGNVRRISPPENTLELTDGTLIAFDDILYVKKMLHK